MARIASALRSSGLKNPTYSISSSSSTTGAKNKNSLCIHVQWFRLMDLRLHDNPSLCQTVQRAKQHQPQKGIVPIFCFDPRILGDEARSNYGSLKCGPRRAQFILESVSDLRRQLEAKGSGLIVAHGKPEQIIPKLLQSVGGNDLTLSPSVFCQREVCQEELNVDKAVRSELTKHHPEATLTTVWGSTLYDIDDLPYPDGPYGIPNTFTPFRNKVEKNCQIGAPLAVPSNEDLQLAPCVQNLSLGEKCSLSYLPSLADLGYSEEDCDIADKTKEDPRSAIPGIVGGETAALARAKEYIWTKDLLKIYFDTRNGMIGEDYSTKFAPWLSHGNISPRYIAKECQRYEQSRIRNKSTYWVVFELLWRDYFKFFALKHGNSIFSKEGTIQNSEKKWGFDSRLFQAWVEGRTGYPLIDANMRELAATGFMSNRGRQNVCSFLALDMKHDWTRGADYFESALLDYDVHSNWGNWCSGAGMTGGRINRFNTVKQSKDYDQHGDYVRHWLPELKNVPTEFVHEVSKVYQVSCMVVELCIIS